jgi:catechol 2,3-dioxygenase-like lactoylglutathione lyase family enzyme
VLHPNGTTAIDHVVVTTPDLDRTVAALEAAGLQARRVRDAGRGDRAIRQVFFRLGDPVLEVVGPPEPSGDGPARFLGLALTVADLDATATALGQHVGEVKDAVQPGRRIATLRRSAGCTTALAFMSPSRPR